MSGVRCYSRRQLPGIRFSRGVPGTLSTLSTVATLPTVATLSPTDLEVFERRWQVLQLIARHVEPRQRRHVSDRLGQLLQLAPSTITQIDKKAGMVRGEV